MAIHHYVLFQFNYKLTEEEKNSIFDEIKVEFEKLPNKINCLNQLTIYRNINPDEDFDILLKAIVPSIEDVPNYSKHPAHMEMVQKYIKPYMSSRACVDIEI